MTASDDPWAALTIVYDPEDLESLVATLYNDPAVRVEDIPDRINLDMTARGCEFRLSNRILQRVLRSLREQERIPAVKPHRRR
jgi:hypothetical protein